MKCGDDRFDYSSSGAEGTFAQCRRFFTDIRVKRNNFSFKTGFINTLYTHIL